MGTETTKRVDRVINVTCDCGHKMKSLISTKYANRDVLNCTCGSVWVINLRKQV